MTKLRIENVNFKDFEDVFGNLKNEFEVIAYEKLTDGQWIETKRFESGRGYYIVDSKLYTRIDYTLLSLNMDFNSITYGACYQIGKAIENKRKIIGNEILFTLGSLSLHKQSYSNGICFYTLQDRNGNFKVDYGSYNISDLISQLEHEIKIDSSIEKESFYKENITIKDTVDNIKNIKLGIINRLQNIA